MIIALGRKTAIAPHRHHGKSESFHVIEGEADIILFSDDGKIEQVVPMGPPDSGKAFYYRVSAPLYHTVLVRSDVFIFQETTKGPWDRAESEEAPWAPPEDSAELADYLGKLDLSEEASS
jgi:cupin fold WbuC family metalloprotein